MPSSPRPTDLRVGLVGCGRAATTLHVPALRRLPGVQVAALSDCETAPMERLAARCPGAVLHREYEALLHDPAVDLVAVCVPAVRHADIAVAALRAGKHVFIEKPLALSLPECDRIVEEARRSASAGRRAAVGFNLRSHRLVRQARAIVASGALGRIELLRTLWTADWSAGTRPPWHSVRRTGGGALLEIGTHQADLWSWLLEAEIETVCALSRSEEFDDQTAVLQARMRSGALVSAAVGQRSTSHNTIEVFGDRGSLRLSCYHADSLEVSAVGGRSRGAWRRLAPLVARARRMPAAFRSARQGGDFLMSYVHQWAHIASAIRSGAPMPATVEDGRQAARAMQAALESVEVGAGVRVGAPAEARGAVPASAR